MATNENEKLQNQPRQPQSLQGLMKFAIEAGSGEDTTCNNNFQPMDAERRAFLEKTLKSLTIDIIEVLQKCISTLHNNKDSADQNENECITALETIQDYVDNIDTANDFFKIGGFSILPICLTSPWPSVRSHGCELIADLAQNNPYCQENLLKCNLLRDLFKLLSDENVVAVKAMYAISCMVRNYDPALQYLLDNEGFKSIIEAIGSKSSTDKLQTKGAFLLRALCLQDNRVRGELVQLNAVEQLSLALKTSSDSREHIMSALLSIICSMEAEESSKDLLTMDSISDEVLSRAKCPDLDLKETLDKFIKDSENKAELQEVNDYSKKLRNLIFKQE